MWDENTYIFKKRKTYFLLWRRIYRFERQYDIKHNGAINDEHLQTVLPNRQKLQKNWMEENNNMSEKEKAIIEDNLKAYENNFGYIKIVKEECGKGFYVFTSEERSESGCWTQFCYNIDYLNGWLYGCVQAANGVMKKIAKK